MKKFIFYSILFILSVFFQSCKQNFGNKFVGKWQDSSNERISYTITKVNENTYQVTSHGFVGDPSSVTVTLQDKNLVGFMNMSYVSYISDSEMLIDGNKCYKFD